MKPPWHEQSGFVLNEREEKAVEVALLLMLDAVRVLAVDPGMPQAVLREALFRVYDLPKRTPRFQREYLSKNGVGVAT